MTEREQTMTEATSRGSEDQREERLRALFAAADPATDPPKLLQQRVADMAGRQGVRAAPLSTAPRMRRRLWTPWRIGLGLAGATALALVAVGMAPMWVAAQVLRRAEAAAGGVLVTHVVTWNIGPDGSRRISREEWQQQGRSLSQDFDDDRVTLIADGKLWTYQPKLNRVTVQNWKEAPNAAPQVPTLKEILRDSARHGWGQIHMLPDTTVRGRRVQQVAIQRAGWRERMLLRVDAESGLPVDAAFQLNTNGRWVTHAIMEPRYNDSPPPGIFQPAFPKSAQRLDLDHAREGWGRLLARGITRRQAGDRTIVIRDIQVNAEGDLFLLYTAGKYPTDDNLRAENYFANRDWNIEVKDDLGTFYEWQPNPWASNQHMGPGAPPAYVFNGERLEGDWWVPAAPQAPWKARRFTITFRANPVNLHDDPHAPARKADYSATAIFTLSVAAPASALIPDYMPYMPMGDMFTEEFMRTSREKARAFYARYEQPDLGKALEHYRQVLRLHQEKARKTGQPVFDSQLWLDIGHVLREMGRKQEARAAFEESVHEAMYPDDQRREAKEALEAVGRDLAWSVGRAAPAFSAIDLNGRPQSVERYRGQVLLIDLWATWNEEARADLPTLKALHDQYRGQGLALLGIGLDYDEAAFRKFVSEHNLPWPQISDSKGTPSLLGLIDPYGSPKPPRTILIDRQSTIRAVDLHGSALQKAVAELLAAG